MGREDGSASEDILLASAIGNDGGRAGYGACSGKLRTGAGRSGEAEGMKEAYACSGQ